MSQAPLVLILPDNHYQRFVGATMTHHAKSNEPLSAENIEIFRTNPGALMPDESPEPQAA